MILVLSATLGRRAGIPFLRTLRRMRWFFLSIVVLYVWFAPVEDVGHVNEFVWYADGVKAGLERVFVLVIILIAVTCFIVTVDRGELLNAVLWLSRPLKVFGLAPERVAVRFTLLFSVLTQIEHIVRDAKQNGEMNAVTDSTMPRSPVWERWGDSATYLFKNTIAQAFASPLESLDVSLMRSPIWYEWLIPCCVGAIGLVFSFVL